MGIFDSLKARIARASRKPVPQGSTFHVEKDASGVYRWFAVFSNKYRDRDNPAEILSSAAHKDFVRAVDAGEWPLPELWLWHMKGSRIGVAEWIAYDEETGFTMGAGVIEDAATAQALAEYEGPLGVSHGMPRKEIERSTEDRTVITRYRTREISPLPLAAAANVLTSFDVKEGNMALPEEKKAYLRDLGWDEARIATVENSLKGLSGVAGDLGLESKGIAEDADQAVEQEPEQEATAEDQAPAEESGKEAEQAEVEQEGPEVEQAVEQEVEAEPKEATAEDGAFKEQIVDALAQVLKMVNEQGERVKALAGAVEALQAEPEEKEQDEAEVDMTPAASVFELAKARAVGSAEAEIDGRTKLAKQKPDEKQGGGDRHTGIGIVDAFINAPQE